jgi:uncharacterized protein
MSPMLYRIALGAIAAGFRQGLPDFAFGLIIISIWAWTIEPSLAMMPHQLQ